MRSTSKIFSSETTQKGVKCGLKHKNRQDTKKDTQNMNINKICWFQEEY